MFWPFISREETLNVAERSPGNFAAESNIPAEKVEKFPVPVAYRPPDAEFIAMFVGRINPDRTEIVEKLTEGNSSINATLRRK